MSPNTWIALAILVVAGAVLVHRARKGGADKKDEVDAEAPRNVEKRRAHSEAEAAKSAPLSAADEAEVAAFEKDVEVWKTDAHPVVGLDDPLGASPLDSYWRLPAVAVEDTPLFAQLLAEMTQPVAEPLALESFTQGWTTADIARLVAEAKAEASA